jgi:hypothetical protein
MIELTTTFLTLDKPNANGRVYTRAVGEAIIEQVKAGRAIGALGVPEGTDMKLSDASHTITDVRIEGDKLIGKIHLLDTMPGRALAMVLSEMDFRPRGMATIDENGVVSDYTLISIDAVRDGA